ncbi:hypothetical protein NLN82_20940 [Citrobacter portucalensis]|uniref:hypothetical protein n=1 Tax=Citrobacter portucalensis TaxID=1639133 RepID=UPI00226BAAE1|nr:hypothetical protein [Citrobacter portucalensis]MCX9038497.1 hypothetical protein [Citrobacter portucalensis]
MSAKSKIITLIIVVLVLAVSITGCLYSLWGNGYSRGYKAGGISGTLALSRMKSEQDMKDRLQAQQTLAALRAWQNRYQQQLANAQKAEADYLSTLAALRGENQKLHKEIDDVTTKWIDEKGKAHPVECVFTRGFVQQYNAALGVPAADIAPVTTGTGNPARTGDTADTRLRASGVTQRDILSNITDNGGQCRALKVQVNSLLDYIGGLSR